MSIDFDQIPGSIRLPGMRTELHSGERPYQEGAKLLLIAPMLTAGTATPGAPIRMPSNPIGAFGAGSIAAEVAIYARRQASLFDIWIMPVTDPAGTKATCKITLNTLPAPGAYPFWVFGRLCQVTVSASDTTSTLATKIAAAATAAWTLPGLSTFLAQPFTGAATAAVSGGSPTPAFVTLTMRHNGVHVDGKPWVDVNLYGRANGSALAAAVAVTYTTGSGTLDMTAALAGIGNTTFEWIGSVFDDSGVKAALESFLADRWSPMNFRGGWAVYADQGDYGTIAAVGAVQNSYRAVQVGQNDSPDPKWAILAQAAADIAQFYDLGAALSEAHNLARPADGRVLRDLNPPRSGRTGYADSERNGLYFDGVAPLRVNSSGQVCFELIPTTYETDGQGQADTNFLWINYPLIALYWKRFETNFVWERHQGTSAADDTEPARKGQTRPSDLKNTIILAATKFRNDAGLIENLDGFVARLVVERSSDPVRMNVDETIDVANPLHVIANRLSASAQYQS